MTLTARQKSAEGIVGMISRSSSIETLTRKGRNGQGSQGRDSDHVEGPNGLGVASRTCDSWARKRQKTRYIQLELAFMVGG